MWQSSILILTVLVVQVYSAPQFITFSDGKLGVNFGGYHAGVGLGGLASGDGRTAGGLYAEAGTPFGPAARAGLGGGVSGKSGTVGGLYAGATAGGNVNAEAGLAGAVGAGKAVGGGFSSANAGDHGSSSVLEGESGASGSSGFSIIAHKSIGIPTTVVKQTEVSVVPIEEVKTVHKKVHGEVKFEDANEITPVAKAGFEANVNANANAQSGFVKEVSKWKGPHYRTRIFPPVYFQDVMSSLFRNSQRKYSQPMWLSPPQYNYLNQVHVEPIPTQVFVHKHKPHRHHVHKTVYVGGYVGAGAEAAPVSKTVVVNTKPIEKRVDIEAEGGAGATINGEHYGPGKVVTFSNSKEVVVSNNAKPSTFFQDIFNIPISTLKAVSGFLTNTAGSTNVSVQKSASVQADSDSISSKHVPLSSSSSSSEAHISVQTPSASKIIDDIFSIPINTLTAVNKFLENNVAGRKRVQATSEVAGEPTRIRLGPYARRRANKHVVIVQEPAEQKPEASETN